MPAVLQEANEETTLMDILHNHAEGMAFLKLETEKLHNDIANHAKAMKVFVENQEEFAAAVKELNNNQMALAAILPCKCTIP